MWAGGRPAKPASDATRGWGVGGGGHFGIEFVLAPRMGMTFEVGGRSSIHALGLDAGATATAGVVFYLGNLRGPRLAQPSSRLGASSSSARLVPSTT